MQRLTVDCQTDRQTINTLTAEEESTRLAELERQQKIDELENKKVTKRHLLKALLELREMKLNQDLFTNSDMTEKQVEIDNLKLKL